MPCPRPISSLLFRKRKRTPNELEEVIAEHDAALAVEKLGKAVLLCDITIQQHQSGRSVESNKKALLKGLSFYLGRPKTKTEILPRALHNKHLHPAVKQSLEALEVLLTDMGDCLDNPSTIATRSNELTRRRISLFKALAEELKMRPILLDKDEVEAFGFPVR